MDQININPYAIPGVRGTGKGYSDGKCKEAIAFLTDYYKITPGALLKRARYPHLSYVRHLLCYFMCSEYNAKLKEIAECLCWKNHTSVIYGIKQFGKGLEVDDWVPNDLKSIHRTVRADYAHTRKLLLQVL